MTISDYAGLLVDAGEYSGREDIAHIFPRFLGLAETKLNRALRVSSMESTTSLVLVNGDVALPTDFLEAREVKTSANVPIRAVSIQQLTESYAGNSGAPAGYAIVGSTLKARPVSSQTLTMTYYAKIPALTRSAPTNWLLSRAPDVYLYALVTEIAIWEVGRGEGSTDKVQAAQQLMSIALSGLTIEDERNRWGNSQTVVAGPTP